MNEPDWRASEGCHWHLLSGVKAGDPAGCVQREVLRFASADPHLGLDSLVTLRSPRNGPDYNLNTRNVSSWKFSLRRFTCGTPGDWKLRQAPVPWSHSSVLQGQAGAQPRKCYLQETPGLSKAQLCKCYPGASPAVSLLHWDLRSVLSYLPVPRKIHRL